MQISRTSGLATIRRARTTPKAPEQTTAATNIDAVQISSTPQSKAVPKDSISNAVVSQAVGGAIGAATGEHLRLIMVGPPGAGKGTQSRFLLEDREGAHISTGAMLREEVANDTELGRKAKPYMDRGELVPDDIILDMVRGRLEKEDSFILDGFPRSVPQAEALDEMLEDLEKPLTSIVLLEVSDETILKRLLKRGRADDNEETIRNRIEVYKQQTEPMVRYFRPQGLIESVNVEGTIETNREFVGNRVEARLAGETPTLSVPIPTRFLNGVEAKDGRSAQEFLGNIDTHVAEGKAPYAPSWSDDQKATLTEKTKGYLNEALGRRGDMTLGGLTEAAKNYTESEALALESSEQNLKYGPRVALLSAATAGLGLLTGNNALAALGGVTLAGSLLVTGHSYFAIEDHKENLRGLAGTRDLLEGWDVSLAG